ncbi:substrate-binding periplasmic protein [Methylobacterium sp. WSM2598]|uniref:substrate-binding periplasmic protein n=1 Tax=Methylobacterium sp. WSM2598 TaxID=398261 RepID=UPI000363475F|nr:transporter substrate-binding domain-containing protein [Methylobacterium sp. WSM2598]
MRRLVLLAALSAALSAALAAPAAARPLDDVVASGTLRVAVYRENAPFSDDGAAGPAGIEVDLARRIAERLKVALDLRLVEAGESVDGDFRLNLWRGDLAGTALADLMLHVPTDRQLALRNAQVFFTLPYCEQRVAFAYRRDRVEAFDSLAASEANPVAVEGTSAADTLLMLAEGGRLRAHIRHFRSFEAAATAFLAGEAPVLGGTRAAIEGALRAAGPKAEGVAVTELAVPGPVRTRWAIGGAVRQDSRDLAYAVGDALAALAASGEMQALFARHGVTFTPPSDD